MEFRNAHTLDGVERTEDIEIQENITFDEMYLSDAVLAGLHACGFVKPSPIQLSAIPLGRCGLDLIVQAKSGTGKTCVFSVIALEMISVVTKATQVLVIAPTREIAVQIGQVINSIASSMADLKSATFIGGTSVQDDKAKLKCCHIAIGTPGRLNQLVSLGSLDLSNVRLLVLDEADELLTGQFKSCIIELVKTLPFTKQILALSATYPPEVTEFLDNFMRSPTHVRLGKEAPALVGVLQFVRLLPDHPQSHQRHKTKFSELLSILSTVAFNQCLVFSNSQLRAESICNQLKSSGWPASFLTGGQIQQERLQAFFALCSYKCRILVSTDLSARGLDSEYVNLVINLDIPTDQATYLHRVGRAGRFGSKGIAVSLVCEGEEWETMRAVTTLTNVQVRILYDDYVSSTFEVKEDLEMVESLDSESLSQWIEKQDKKKIKYKPKGETRASISNQVKKKSSSLVACQELIQAKELPNQIQTKNEAVKDILHDYANNSDIYTFTHSSILDQIQDKWETHSKCDDPQITSSNYLESYPSAAEMKILGTFVMGIEAKANERERCKNQEPHKALTATIDDLQCVMQGIPLQLSENDFNPVKESSEKVPKETETHKMILSEPQKCSLNLKDDGNASLVAGAGRVELEVLSDPANNCDKKNQNIKDKEHQKSARQKKYAENTGFGEWVSVPKENLPTQRTSNSNESTVSAKKKAHRSISNYQYDDSYYNYEEINDLSDTQESSNRNLYSSELETNYYASIDAYINSATKFAEMMEYVKCLGRMSALIAHNQSHNHLCKY